MIKSLTAILLATVGSLVQAEIPVTTYPIPVHVESAKETLIK